MNSLIAACWMHWQRILLGRHFLIKRGLLPTFRNWIFGNNLVNHGYIVVSAPIIFNIQIEPVEFLQASTTKFENRLNIHTAITERKKDSALRPRAELRIMDRVYLLSDQASPVNTALALIYYFFSPWTFLSPKKKKTKKLNKQKKRQERRIWY